MMVTNGKYIVCLVTAVLVFAFMVDTTFYFMKTMKILAYTKPKETIKCYPFACLTNVSSNTCIFDSHIRDNFRNSSNGVPHPRGWLLISQP